ncbi:DUF5343 domain-containing protein [Variovorax sp. J2P1-59]|uniref:DUF5343 domain-containing protein n=1 Tax=Variovorax flavidus TaxID=3053501 RepID=UPI0025780D43|nr:DUF5343 domain-containing protein [Variovorax sp. J2P1-59]MDM0074430.1 DUF5343 domain-containing protein [Variovorax sp. J2P1-59]
MAIEKATTYPKISKRIWVLLRARFAKAMPTAVGPDYVTSTSDMTDASARSNVLSPLRDLGILDKDNKPTDLAERWRHDDEYAAVCKEIRAATYPQALIEAYPEGDASQKEGIKKWFMKNSKVGETAGKMFADTYMLLSQGDLSTPEGDAKAAPAARSTKASTPSAKKASAKASAAVQPAPTAPAQEHGPATAQHGFRKLPSVHIDVQVHISPDTTPEQIDRIFASMSKHLGSYIG